MAEKLRGSAARCAAAADLVCMYMGSTLVTPLYVIYGKEFGFEELTLTLIYSAYSVGNIASLFVLGRLSDQIGRRRTVLPAVGVAALATLVFLFAQSTAWLFVARTLSGVAIGLATGAASAWVVDLTRHRKEERGAAITTSANFSGLAIAALLGGVLAQYAPYPLQLPFVLYLVVLAGLAVVVSRTKETVEDCVQTFSETSLAPRIGVPRGIRARFLSPAVTAFAVFAVTGFYAALGPTLLRRDLGIENVAAGGALVFALFGSAALAASATSGMKARTSMVAGAGVLIASVALLVAAQLTHGVVLLAAGAAVTGVAAALGCRGSFQLISEIAPDDRRAEVISTYKIVCFTGNALPVIGVGVLSSMYTAGVATASLAAVTALLALLALATELMRDPESRLESSPG